jgi:hypothetical protein
MSSSGPRGKPTATATLPTPLFFQFSFAKTLVVAITLLLAWLSLVAHQPVQAMVAILAMWSLVTCPVDGDALMFFPLLFLSERCLQNVMSLGHSPLLFYGACLISFIQKGSMSWASISVGLTGLSVFSALTLNLGIAAGCCIHVAVSLFTTAKLSLSMTHREVILIGHLCGFFASDAVTNTNLRSAEKLATITSFPHVGGCLALVCAMAVGLAVSIGSRCLASPPESIRKQIKGGLQTRQSGFAVALLFWTLTGTCVGCAYLYASYQFEEDAFVWLWAYLHGSKLRLYSLALWLTGIPIAVLCVAVFGGDLRLVVRRKLFHFIGVVAFVIPTIRDPSFMGFSAAVATALGVLCEIGRFHQVPGFRMVGRFLATHIDDRDNGTIRTHLYLIFGMVFPAILRHRYEFVTSRPLPGVAELMLDLAPGIFALGIQDSLAAIIGSSASIKWRKPLSALFVSRFFPSSLNASLMRKTIIGTTAGIAVSCGVWASLLALLRAPAWLHPLTLGSFVPIIFTGIFEAVTDGVDNLEIPIMGSVAGNILCAILLRV